MNMFAYTEQFEDTNHYPRSLILFIAVELDYFEIFKYLWNDFGFIDWGIYNLEWMVMVLCYNM